MGLFDLALRIVALCVLLACAETLARHVHGAVCWWLMRRPWAKIAQDLNPASGNYLVFGLLCLNITPMLIRWLSPAVKQERGDWCPWRESDPRPLPYQGSALPLSHMGNLCAKEENWSGIRDSNSRPIPWQGIALPTELIPHMMVI